MNYSLILHSIFRWVILLFGLLVIIYSITGIITKRNYTNRDNKTSLFFMVCCDFQLLMGLIIYFKGAWFDNLKSHTSEVMKDSVQRFFSMEHALMMIIAWLLVHIGHSMVKRSETDAKKHKLSLIFFGLAMVIILAMIPWPFRQVGIARQWFPQF